MIRPAPKLNNIKNPRNIEEVKLITTKRVLIAGPAVSLKGSPTVSPVIEALCVSVPLPPRFPSSIYFLALSQAPPALDMNIAKTNPLKIAPAKNAPSDATPNNTPTDIGIIIEMRGACYNLRIP